MPTSDTLKDETGQRTVPTYGFGHSESAGGGASSFDAEVRDLLEQSIRGEDLVRPRISNIFIAHMTRESDGRRFRFKGALRAMVEAHDEDEFLAMLVEKPWDRTFVGYGQSQREAVSELLDMLWHDYFFYMQTPDGQLTQDARRMKQHLIGRVQEVGPDQ